MVRILTFKLERLCYNQNQQETQKRLNKEKEDLS